MKENTQARAIQDFFTGTYPGFVVFHFGARLAYGPYQFWLLDVFFLLPLLADVIQYFRLKAFLARLKVLTQRKSFRYGLLLHVAVGVITGCIIGYAQHAK